MKLATNVMLKKIAIDQLAPGMYLHGVCGSWFDHPFWRRRFLIQDVSQVRELKAAGLAECWIDLERGLDAVPPAADAPPPRSSVEPSRPTQAAQAAPAHAAPASCDDESERAALVALTARKRLFGLFEDVRAGRSIDARGCRSTVDDIAASLSRNASSMLGIVRLKSHDDYTFMHSVAVCALMVSLARKLALSEAQVREAGLAGLLHDVGKAMVPVAILNKPGPLTDAEFSIVKRHSRLGHDILATNAGIGEAVADTCLRHHERPDGKGYPDGVRGDALSLQARMAAVCDVYDAITSDRPYKRSWCPAESLVRMSEWAKTGQFDPVVFRAFVECVGVFPVGTLVRLKSDRLAVVVENIPASIRAPRVRVFFSGRSNMPIPIETVDLSSAECRDAIVARESNEKWKFTHLVSLTYGDTAKIGGF